MAIVVEGLTTGDVARLLGLSNARVQQFVQDGRLRPVAVTPLGRIFDPAAVEAFAAQRQTQKQERGVPPA